MGRRRRKKTYWKRVNINGSVTRFTRNPITGTVTTETRSAEEERAANAAFRRKLWFWLKIIFGILFLAGGGSLLGESLAQGIFGLALGALLIVWAYKKK